MSLPVGLVPWVAIIVLYGERPFVYAEFPTEKQCTESARGLNAMVRSEYLMVCKTEDEARARWPGLFEKEQRPFQRGPARGLIEGSTRPGAVPASRTVGSLNPQGSCPRSRG